MVDAIKEVTGVDFWKEMTLEEAQAIAKEKNVPVEKHFTSVGHIINAFFEEFVEETLIQPTFVYGHPVEVSPLAKKKTQKILASLPLRTLHMTKEYGNAFTELNDPIDQIVTFLKPKQKAKRNLVMTKQLELTTTTSKPLNTVCHQQVDLVSVSTALSCSSQTQQQSAMSYCSQR